MIAAVFKLRAAPPGGGQNYDSVQGYCEMFRLTSYIQQMILIVEPSSQSP